MFGKLRLRTVNFAVSIIIGLSGILLAAVLSFTVLNIGAIETSWIKYQADHSEKARLESALRKAIGYGGMIHHFKNYVLRHQEPLVDNIHSDIGAAMAVVGQYNSLVLSEAEKIALEDVSQALNHYEGALLKSREMIRRAKTPEEIDSEVKVEDTSALRGLNTLRTEVERLAGEEDIARGIKGRLAANLRAALGYGGMIHEFKNLVLRGDLPRVEKIKTHIARIENIFLAYTALGPTIAEEIALDDISSAVNAYKSKLGVAEELILAGATVSEIDISVKVDDAKALRGLSSLDREAALQVDELQREVGSKLSFLTSVVPAINWIFLTIIVLAVLSSVWIFNVYVIRPITSMIGLMGRLADEETELEIPYTGRPNEIGQMASALETFRQTTIARKAAEAEIIELAGTDSLTGLYNRKRFELKLHDSLKMAARTKTCVAVLMIDLDNFKPVNDQNGHAAGDEVLRVVGERLGHICRDTDFVARLGGDEFAIIATAVDAGEHIEIMAHRIIDQLNLPVYYQSLALKIGGSVGISIYPDDSEDAIELVQKSDKALYEAKNGGRNTFRFAENKVAKLNLA